MNTNARISKTYPADSFLRGYANTDPQADCHHPLHDHSKCHVHNHGKSQCDFCKTYVDSTTAMADGLKRCEECEAKNVKMCANALPHDCESVTYGSDVICPTCREAEYQNKQEADVLMDMGITHTPMNEQVHEVFAPILNSIFNINKTA